MWTPGIEDAVVAIVTLLLRELGGWLNRKRRGR